MSATPPSTLAAQAQSDYHPSAAAWQALGVGLAAWTPATITYSTAGIGPQLYGSQASILIAPQPTVPVSARPNVAVMRAANW